MDHTAMNNLTYSSRSLNFPDSISEHDHHASKIACLPSQCDIYMRRFAFRHWCQYVAADFAADRLPDRLRGDGALGDVDDVSTSRHHVTGAHRAVHEAADNHSARLAEQLDAGRDSRRPHVLRRVHAEAGHRLRAQ